MLAFAPYIYGAAADPVDSRLLNLSTADAAATTAAAPSSALGLLGGLMGGSVSSSRRGASTDFSNVQGFSQFQPEAAWEEEDDQGEDDPFGQFEDIEEDETAEISRGSAMRTDGSNASTLNGADNAIQHDLDAARHENENLENLLGSKELEIAALMRELQDAKDSSDGESLEQMRSSMRELEQELTFKSSELEVMTSENKQMSRIQTENAEVKEAMVAAEAKRSRARAEADEARAAREDAETAQSEAFDLLNMTRVQVDGANLKAAAAEAELAEMKTLIEDAKKQEIEAENLGKTCYELKHQLKQLNASAAAAKEAADLERADASAKVAALEEQLSQLSKEKETVAAGNLQFSQRATQEADNNKKAQGSIKGLETKLGEKSKKYDALVIVNQRISAEKGEEERKLHKAESTIKSTKESLQEKRKEIADLTKDKKNLERASKGRGGSASGSNPKQKVELDKLKEKVRDLLKSKGEMAASSAKKESEIKTLSTKLERAQKAAEKPGSAESLRNMISDQDGRIAALSESEASLTQQLHQTEEQLLRCLGCLQVEQQQRASALTAAAETKQRLSALQAISGRDQQADALIKAAEDETAAAVAHSTKAVSRAEEWLARFKKAEQSLVSARLERDQLTQVAEENEVRATMTGVEAAKMKEELLKQKEVVEAVIEEKEQLDAALGTAIEEQEENEEVGGAAADKVIELGEKLSEMAETLKDVRAELAEAIDDKEGAEAELKMFDDLAKEKEEELRAEFGQRSSSNDVGLQRLHTENAELQQDLKELEMKNGEDLETARAECKIATERCAELEARHKVATEKYHRSETELKSLKRTLTEMESAMRAAKTENDRLQEEKVGMTGEIIRAHTEDATRASLQVQLEAARSDVFEYQTMAAEAADNLQYAMDKQQKLAEAKEELSSRVEELNKELTEQSLELGAAEESAAAFEQERQSLLEQQEAAAAAHKATLADAQRKASTVEKEAQLLRKTQRTRLNSSTDSSLNCSSCTALRAELRDMKLKHDEMERELEDQNETVEMLVSDKERLEEMIEVKTKMVADERRSCEAANKKLKKIKAQHMALMGGAARENSAPLASVSANVV